MKPSIPFTGLEAQASRLRHAIDNRIARVIDHGQFIMGPEVRELEQRLAGFCGAKHALGVANGTDALQIALMAYGVGAGDAVFLPAFTYTATAEVVLLLGARPVFVDVEAGSFNIDCADLERQVDRIKRAGGRPRAIIAVDLFGLPADWDRLNAIASVNELVLIADAAQSFGASIRERRVGSLAPITTTSFFPAKPLGCFGDGGAIFTDNDDIAAVISSIRTHGQGRAKYETVRVGVNSRLDTVQAAVLLAKLDVFAEEIALRNVLAGRYEAALADIVVTPGKSAGITSAWAQYTIRTPHRDQLQVGLKERGVPTAIYYPKPMSDQPAYSAYADTAYPVSEQLCSEVLSLPMNPYHDDEQVERVVTAVREVLAEPTTSRVAA